MTATVIGSGVKFGIPKDGSFTVHWDGKIIQGIISSVRITYSHEDFGQIELEGYIGNDEISPGPVTPDPEKSTIKIRPKPKPRTWLEEAEECISRFADITEKLDDRSSDIIIRKIRKLVAERE